MLRSRSNSQLVNARAYADHGLPIIRLKPLLNQVELVAGDSLRILWESSQILKGGREALYKFLYTDATPEPSGLLPQLRRLWVRPATLSPMRSDGR